MLNVKKTLTKMLTTMKSAWLSGTKTVTGYGFSANQSRPNLEVSFTKKTGYACFVYSANCTSHSAVDVISAYCNQADGKIIFWAVNRTGSALTNVNFSFSLFYFNTSMFGGSVTQP